MEKISLVSSQTVMPRTHLKARFQMWLQWRRHQFSPVSSSPKHGETQGGGALFLGGWRPDEIASSNPGYQKKSVVPVTLCHRRLSFEF